VDHGHEVCVSLPAGYDMDMDVPGNACSGVPGDVYADIISVGRQRFMNDIFRGIYGFEYIQELTIGKPGGIADVFIRRNHYVAVVIRENIQDTECVPAAEDDVGMVF